MRPSNRSKVLEAAVRVAERDGVTSVTLDSVAAEAKLTKGGLMYHFRSKDALLDGIQEFLAASWDDAMAEAAGKPAEDASAEEKVAAYARVATQSASSADLAFILEFAKHPAASAPWAEVAAKWTPSPDQARENERMFELFIARLAADGLWTFESLLQTPLDEGLRQRIAERIATMISVAEE